MMNLDRIGKYRIVGKIGQGAMGEVYKAQDPLLNRFVAIKTIAPAFAAEPDFRRRFQREAQSAAQLNHPNIVTVFDFGEEDGLIYMAMELLEGRDLKDLIRSRDAHLGDKLAIMEQLCDGLGFAHAKGVVHRDLKPGNIHVQPNGQVKILDFGLARLGDSDITRTGTVMGTPNYMSPEQIRGQKVDARSDVFSLGAVFYELLCHHRPFEADSDHDVRFQIVRAIAGADPEVGARGAAGPRRGRGAGPRQGPGPPLRGRRRDGTGPRHRARRDRGRHDRGARQARRRPHDPPGRGRDRGPAGRARAGLRHGAGSHGAHPRPHPGRGRAEPPAPYGPSGSHRRGRSGHAGALERRPLAGARPRRRRRARGGGRGGGRVAPLARRGPGAAPVAAGADQAGIMTDVFVTNQVELARADLADRDYAPRPAAPRRP